MLTIADIFRFQIGDRGSIERVLQTRWSLLAGAVMVVTAGVARHYDQKYLIWEWWVVQPFGIALVSAFGIFLAAWTGLRMGRPKRDDRPHFLQQFAAFLGAFLMTSPLAWLYAIPVEQWMGLEQAARINIGLLLLVASWRVALMVRVIAVATGFPWWRCLVVVLLPSAVEAFVLSVVLHMRLVDVMGGVQLPAHEQILDDALMVVNGGAALTAVVSLVLFVAFATVSKRRAGAFPEHKSGVPKSALLFAVAALLVWTAYAWPWQVKQYQRFLVRIDIRQKDYGSALDRLAVSGRESFPSPGLLPPDPFDPYAGTSRLIGMLQALRPAHPAWLRQEYYESGRLAVLSRNRHSRYFRVANLIEALASTEGGREFIRKEPQPWLALLNELRPEPDEYGGEVYEEIRIALEKAELALPEEPKTECK